MLHKREYYDENIVKYFRCKVCERARLAKMRDAVRYCEVDGCCCFCCPGCKKAVNMDKLEAAGHFSYYTCNCKWELRFRHSKKADARTGLLFHPATYRCQRCYEYGCRKCGTKSNFTVRRTAKLINPEQRKVPKLVIKLKKQMEISSDSDDDVDVVDDEDY